MTPMGLADGLEVGVLVRFRARQTVRFSEISPVTRESRRWVPHAAPYERA